MRWLSWALCCCLLIIAALLRKRGGTLRELRLAQPARTPTKFLVLMMKGRVGSVWLRDLLMANPEILVPQREVVSVTALELGTGSGSWLWLWQQPRSKVQYCTDAEYFL